MRADVVATFCDTNILLYRFTDDPKSNTVAAIMAEPFAISVQILNEFASVSRRKFKIDWPQINLRLRLLQASAAAVHPITVETHALSLHCAERYQFALYYSMIVASALLAGCNTLFSEDMQHGMVIEDRLTLLNPFASS